MKVDRWYRRGRHLFVSTTRDRKGRLRFVHIERRDVSGVEPKHRVQWFLRFASHPAEIRLCYGDMAAGALKKLAEDKLEKLLLF